MMEIVVIYCVEWLQHAVVFVNGEQYYGAKASLNIWAPRVTDQYEFSLSQIWVISGSFGNDLNTIEAGWQASFWTKSCLLYFQDKKNWIFNLGLEILVL